MTQQQRIESMKSEFVSLGGVITTLEEVPPHIEEEFLRQTLKRPDRGLLLRQGRGISEREFMSMTLAERIKAACDSTPPKTRERMNALAAIRWVLREQNDNYAALDAKGNVIAVESVNDALVFDGRDNEEMKRGYYGRITGMDYTVELL